MAARVLVPLVDGFEEIEAVAVVDLLRRAGMAVSVAGFGKDDATGSHDMKMATDMRMEHALAEDFDAIVLPGGPGVRTLQGNASLCQLLREFAAADKLVAAICAAPTVLVKAGLLDGRAATCFPAVESQMKGALMHPGEVVRDGQFITSQGAGTAIPFALSIVEYFDGANAARHVADQIIFRQG